MLMMLPLCRLDHVTADPLRQQESPAQVDVQNPVELLGRVILHLHALVDSGHAHQRVDVAELFQHLVHQARDVVRLGHVGHDCADRQRLRDLARRLIQRGLFAAGDDDLRAALGKALRQRSPDAPAAAGDEHNLVFHREQAVFHRLRHRLVSVIHNSQLVIRHT